MEVAVQEIDGIWVLIYVKLIIVITLGIESPKRPLQQVEAVSYPEALSDAEVQHGSPSQWYLCWGTRQLSRHNTQASSSKECVGSGSDTLSSCYQWICQHWICQKISQTQNCHTKENLKRANPFLTYKAQASIHQLHSHLSYLKNPVHFFSLAKTDE